MRRWSYKGAERKKRLKRFIVKNLKSKSLADIMANFTFWPWIDYAIATIAGVPFNGFVATSIIGGLVGLMLTPPFGRWIDLVRRVVGT